MRSRLGAIAFCVGFAWGCSSTGGSGGSGDDGPDDSMADSTAMEGGSSGSSSGESPDGTPGVDSAMNETGAETGLQDTTVPSDDATSDAMTTKEDGSDGANADGPSTDSSDGGADGALADGTVASQDGGGDGAVDGLAADAPPADAPQDASTAEASAADAADATTQEGGDAADAGSADDAADGGSAGDAADAAEVGPPVSVIYTTGVTVSTAAGGGQYGDVDGPDASFSNPTGIALFGPDGLIVVENDTGAIRTISAAGVVRTVGTSPVDKAQTSPFTIVPAPQGYYYSTDFDQSGLHVDGGGAIWNFLLDDAGGGTSSLVKGSMYLPRTLVPLPGGDLFVFDTGKATFSPVTVEVAERLAPDSGALTLIAGHAGQSGFANGEGGAALFGTVFGGVLLPDGSGVLVADCTNNQLRLIALDGTVSTFAGSTTAGWVDGPQSSALFSCPHALAIDLVGNIYVSDLNNNAIRRISAGGNVTTLAGNGTQGFADGVGSAAEIYGAEGLVVSADGSTLYVADGTLGNGALPYNRIRKFTLPALDGG